MVEMGQESVFQIRIDDATVLLVKAVLCDDTSSVADRLRDELSSWGSVFLRVGDAKHLHDALIAYANDEAREGSSTQKKALHFAAALEDHFFAAQAKEEADVAKMLEATDEEPALNKDAHAALLEKEKVDRLRDEMLRQVFLGGPRKKIDIWGNVVDDDEPLTRADLRKMAKTTSSEDWKDALYKDYRDKAAAQEKARREEAYQAFSKAMGKNVQYKASKRIKLNGGDVPVVPRTKPIADVEADKVLTGDAPMNYNEDMKIEGATTLLKEQQGGPVGTHDKTTGGTVVSTVSSFLRKTGR